MASQARIRAGMDADVAHPGELRSQPATALEHPPLGAVADLANKATMEVVNRVGRVSDRVSLRPSWVQERLIAALVPDAVGVRDDVVVPPLPALPVLSRLHEVTRSVLVVSTTRMDPSGRIQERLLLRELGWEPGRRLEMDTLHGMIVIAAAQAGRHAVDRRGGIGLPAALRRMCGISCGPPLVLAAAVPKQVMVIHPATTVASLLTGHYTDLIQAEHARTEPGRTTQTRPQDSP
jgi:hypothetical protein